MKIRLATSEDKSAVLALFDEFSDFLGSSDQKASAIGGGIFEEVIERDDTKIFVADDGTGLVGVITLYLLPNIRHGWMRGHIEDFFVSASQRSSGVGAAMFDAVQDYCRAHGVKVIKLDSGNELADAHRFYEKHGGKTTERFFRFDL